MGKTFKIIIKEKPKRIGHTEHRSGSGEHDNRPKRERTREKQNKSWEKDYGIHDD